MWVWGFLFSTKVVCSSYCFALPEVYLCTNWSLSLRQVAPSLCKLVYLSGTFLAVGLEIVWESFEIMIWSIWVVDVGVTLVGLETC